MNNEYVLITPTLSGFESNMDVDAESLRQVVRSAVSNTASGEFSGVFAAAVDTSYPIQDAIYTSAVEYGTLAADAAMYRALLIISIIVLGVSTVWLTIIAGRRASDEEIHINVFRLPRA